MTKNQTSIMDHRLHDSIALLFIGLIFLFNTLLLIDDIWNIKFGTVWKCSFSCYLIIMGALKAVEDNHLGYIIEKLENWLKRLENKP